jgi:hypothetical protein
MANLVHTLQAYDPGFLEIVARLWGVEFDASTGELTAERLAAQLLDHKNLIEIIESLPADARSALSDLAHSAGRLPWGLFTRRHGAVREMGVGRRDREQPFHKPVSPAEILWYRALLARAFFDTPSGLQEFAYIPSDLLVLLPLSQDGVVQALGRPATPLERAYPSLATDNILDDVCTLLAGLRLSLPLDGIPLSAYPPPYPLSPRPLIALLSCAGLLNHQDLPLLAQTRAHLEAGRAEALLQLVQAWLASPTFNELAMIPQLSLEGEWANDPLATRRVILDFLSSLPLDTWWSLSSFVGDIQQTQPDFQRPAGDYDSWFIRQRQTGDYLRGFEHWDQVDGALIRFMICGPFHWLGILDLASPQPDEPVSAFRFSSWGRALLGGTSPQDLAAKDEKIYARSDGRLRLSRRVPRTVRYQVARFCQWDGTKDNFYRYLIVPSSLERARRQDLQIPHLLALLRRHASALPPVLIKSLERWEAHGTEARIERLLVLRVASPDLLQELRASRAARFLGDPLGPTTIVVKPGAAEKVLAALADLGCLGAIDEMED